MGSERGVRGVLGDIGFELKRRARAPKDYRPARVSELLRELTRLVGTQVGDAFTIRSGAGMGTVAHVPWLGVFVDRPNVSARTSRSVVVLFSTNGNRVYLSLAQPVDETTSAALRTSAATLRRAVKRPDSRCVERIELESAADRPRKYEAGNVWALPYSTTALPTEDQFASDLRAMIEGLIAAEATSAADPPDSPAADNAWPAFTGQSHVEARRYLVELMRLELVGPSADDEVLRERPSTRYVAGMLAARGETVEMDADEQTEIETGAEEETDRGGPVRGALCPSAIGISVSVNAADIDLVATGGWGEYVYERREVEGKAVQVWARTPRSFDSVAVQIRGRSGRSRTEVGPGIFIEWSWRPLEDSTVLGAFLVNRRPPITAARRDEAWIFQPWLRLAAASGAKIFLARSDPLRGLNDEEIKSLELLYRDRPAFALGHGTAAEWDSVDENHQRAGVVSTRIMPLREVPPVLPVELATADALDMAWLSRALPDDLSAALDIVVVAYETWINGLRKQSGGLSNELIAVAQENISGCNETLDRIREGARLVKDNREAREAFGFANQAMLLQRSHSDWIRLPRDERPPAPTIAARWRPFQIAFVLLNLPSLTDSRHPHRQVADLLWFPTGGGKTEAYLALVAYALALRRLRGDVEGMRADCGTVALMRYTLRLLTVQQFERAATLICACETVRRTDESTWGTKPFGLGLWVGGSTSPNTWEQADKALLKLQSGGALASDEGTPVQLVKCPWCGTDLSFDDYRSDRVTEKIMVRCPNHACAFSSIDGIPIAVVDEQIYRECPSFVIATVDKFARMPWVGQAQSLFGYVDLECPRHGFFGAAERHARSHTVAGKQLATTSVDSRHLLPPQLIIQDELHLISGPLGTMVGLYESAIDSLCTYRVGAHLARPKIVASTATIRRAREQIRRVFNRGVRVFPPPGIDGGNSFFAFEGSTDKDPGRVFVGLYAPGKSIKTTLVRIYAVLLAGTGALQRKDRALADPYHTLIAYFTTLKELGAAVRLVSDDVRGRMVRFASQGLSTRNLDEVRELTGRRRSSEIPLILDELAKRLGNDTPIDVLLASSMISVGVDIPRLSLMVVNGQPKTTAEYIQTTSRVGRRYPGLVVTLYNWSRPRDISHYEAFRGYHDNLYRHVEGATVTPFSARARDRALHAVLVSLQRLSIAALSSNDGASRLQRASGDVARAIDVLCDRAAAVAPDSSAEVGDEARSRFDEWANAVQNLRYVRGRGLAHRNDPALLRRAEHKDGGLWPTPSSMRGVEPVVDLFGLE